MYRPIHIINILFNIYNNKPIHLIAYRLICITMHLSISLIYKVYPIDIVIMSKDIHLLAMGTINHLLM
jgi:hypothetical protein